MRTEFSKKTMREAWKRCEMRCEGILPSGERCNENLEHKPKEFDHRIPDGIGGDNSLQNCQVLCIRCHKDKTNKIDIPLVAKTKRNWDNYNGIPSRAPKLRSRGFPQRQPQCTATRPIRKFMQFGN